MDRIRRLALVISASLAIISVALMIVEKTITAEAWALLLLAPIPAGFAMTRHVNELSSGSGLVGDWADDADEVEDGGIGDPTESGFDIPVL
tara:strand:- start:334 stop:606 length:273 start_codon:yes stop_codon:yes gene_type:complete